MIHKIEIEGEEVYLKKDFTGFRIIHPIKNSDGSINWKNLICGGSYYRLIIIGLIVLGLIVAISEYSSAVKIANECLKNQININSFIR